MAPRSASWVLPPLFALVALAAGVYGVKAQEIVRPVSEILMVCAGCHNPQPGTLPASEAQRIPRLGGQQPEYLRAALEAYRTRQRDHFYMRGMAAGLRGDELEAAIRHLSSPPGTGTTPDSAGAPPAPAARCIACHGSANQPPATPQTPRLAGQHAPYIEHAFLAYASGQRQHPLMTAQAQAADGTPSLSPDELRAVAAWFSRQRGLVPR
jgi:cytochrome c553